MRTRVAVLVVVLGTVLVGCSDGGDEPDAKGSETPAAQTTDTTTDTTTVDCAQYAGTSEELADAQAALYGQDAKARSAAIKALTATLGALKDDAPDDVDAALDTLVSGFEQTAELLDDPAAADPAALQELAPKLSEAGRTVTEYIVEECGG